MGNDKINDSPKATVSPYRNWQWASIEIQYRRSYRILPYLMVVGGDRVGIDAQRLVDHEQRTVDVVLARTDIYKIVKTRQGMTIEL